MLFLDEKNGIMVLVIQRHAFVQGFFSSVPCCVVFLEKWITCVGCGWDLHLDSCHCLAVEIVFSSECFVLG